MRNPEPTWEQHAQALIRKVTQLHALSYALRTLGAELGEHLTSPNSDDIEPIEPLAELSLRLCREVEEHFAVLEFHCRNAAKAAEDRAEEHDQ